MDVLLIGSTLLAQAADAATGAGAEPARLPTLLDYVRDGGILSYVLIALSIVAVALILRNLFALRQREFAPPEVMSSLESFLSEGRIADAEKFCRIPANRCYVTTVMSEAFSRTQSSGFGVLEFRSAVEDVASGEAEEIHRMNDGIGIIAAVGPMLGLLGTVIGMIGAFRAIGGLQGAARSSELATFMSMALVNTAQGLIVAIPATIAFAIFRRRIDHMLHLISRDLERFASYVSTGGASRGPEHRDNTTSAGSSAAAPVGAGSRGSRA